MQNSDLGIDEKGNHNSILTPFEFACIRTLERIGQGEESAISAQNLTNMTGLYENTRGNDYGKRNLRKLVNHLIMSHDIPIICQAGVGGGYYLPGDASEVERFHQAFHRRAMTGLVKASRGKKASFVEIMAQLSLGFDDPQQQAAIEQLRLTPDEDSVPAWVHLVTNLLDRLSADPERYAAEIRKLQTAYGDIFVPREKVSQLKEKTAEFQKLLAEISGIQAV